MVDPINLRRARKIKARREYEAVAAANRAKFGMPKAERERARLERDRAQSHLDGAQMDTAPTHPPEAKE